MIYTTRLLTAKDAPTYRDIRLESLREHPEAFGARYEEQSKLRKLFFEEELEREDSIHKLIGVFKLRKLVGLCTLTPHGPYSELNQMYVRSGHRSKGIAQKLITFAAKAAQAHGSKSLRLSVRIANKPALKTYQAFGFEILDRNDAPKSHIMEYTIPNNDKFTRQACKKR